MPLGKRNNKLTQTILRIPHLRTQFDATKITRAKFDTAKMRLLERELLITNNIMTWFSVMFFLGCLVLSYTIVSYKIRENSMYDKPTEHFIRHMI
jgi:hypothetical protein